MDTKTRPIYMLSTKTHFRPQDTYRLKVRGWRNIFHANGRQKKAGVAILISDKVKVKLLSHVRLFATLWTLAYQAPPSMGFSKQEYWSGLHFLLQEIFPTQGSNLRLLHSRQMFNSSITYYFTYFKHFQSVRQWGCISYLLLCDKLIPYNSKA